MNNGRLVTVEIWYGGNSVRSIPYVYKNTISMDEKSNKISFRQKDDRYDECVSYIFDVTGIGVVVLG